jgi:CBS domain-containing protein
MLFILQPPVFVAAESSVYDAVQMMTDQKSSLILVKTDQGIGIVTDKKIKYLLIEQDNQIIGVLEQIDLLNYLSNHTRLVAVQIDRAQNKAQLKVASQNMTNMIKAFNANGIKIKYLMQWVTELNQQVFKKLYAFIAPPALLENSCFIVMGSEGRGEQILKTDQDNAIIFLSG